jgi:hypothetical protein
MVNRVLLLALMSVTAIGGCGDDEGNPTGDGGPPGDGGSAPDGGELVCGDVICDQVLCGTITDDCGESFDCGLCRYSAEVVTTTGVATELAWNGGLLAAYYDTSTGAVTLASRSAEGAWSPANVAELDLSTSIEYSGVNLIVFDGQPWLAWVSEEDGVSVAVPQSATTWQVEVADTSSDAYYTDLAVTSDVAAVIYAGLAEVSVAERRDGAWTTPFTQPLAGDAADVAVAVVDGAVHALWFDRGDKTLRMAVGVEGSYTVHDLHGPAINSGSLRSLDVEVGDGRLWLLLGISNQLLFGEVVGTQWNERTLDGNASAEIDADRQNALVMRSGGSPSAAYFRRTGLFVGESVGTAWATQSLTSTCDEGFVGAVVDDQGAIHVSLTECGTVNRRAMWVMSRQGAYPADYRDTCGALAERICNAAASCGDGCVSTSDGDSTLCVDLGCAADVAAKLCGESTQDPQWMYACDDATATPVCDVAPGDSTESIVLPAACDAAWNYELPAE